MEMRYEKSALDSGFVPELRELLIQADREFVPPLSQRCSTTQSVLAGEASGNGIDAYFDEMQHQPVILALENGVAAGFMAFKQDYLCEQIRQTPNLYVSTAVVAPQFRGRGLMTAFYKTVMDQFPGVPVFTRTWSSNGSHLHVLEKLGFREVARLKNHRGEGLDTVYFGWIQKEMEGKYV